MKPLKERRAFRGILLLLMLAVGVVAFFYFGKEPPAQRIAHGAYLNLGKLKVGRTNTFSHGNWAEKILGGYLPSKGVDFAGIKLKPSKEVKVSNSEGSMLVGELKLSGAGWEEFVNRRQNPDFSQEFRVAVKGEDSIEFFSGLLRIKKYSDGYFAYPTFSSFPRLSRKLHFRVEAKDRYGFSWKTVARFAKNNPAPASIKNWRAQELPIVMKFRDTVLTVGEVSMKAIDEMLLASSSRNVLIPFQVEESGVNRGNWSLYDLKIEDASGNLEVSNGFKGVKDPWLIQEKLRGCDPKLIWRIRGILGRDKDFPSTNLFSFQIPANQTVSTNLGGTLVTLYRMNEMVGVTIMTNLSNRKVHLVGMENQDGRRMLGNREMRMSFVSLREMLLSTNDVTLKVTVAIEQNIPFEFFTRPRFIETSTRKPTEAGFRR